MTMVKDKCKGRVLRIALLHELWDLWPEMLYNLESDSWLAPPSIPWCRFNVKWEIAFYQTLKWGNCVVLHPVTL